MLVTAVQWYWVFKPGFFVRLVSEIGFTELFVCGGLMFQPPIQKVRACRCNRTLEVKRFLSSLIFP